MCQHWYTGKLDWQARLARRHESGGDGGDFAEYPLRLRLGDSDLNVPIQPEQK